MGNIKSPAWYGGGLAGVLIPGANLGNVFYVDGVAGLNANDGLTPFTPKLTLTAGLALCTNNINDTIVVLDYWQPAGETWPVSINKDKVNIVASPSGSYYPWGAVDSAGNTACFSIAADDVIVRGFSFTAGATAAGIVLNGNHARCGIYDCAFLVGQHGILSEAGGCAQALQITNNFFQQSLTAQCIYINDDPAFIRINNNVFDAAQAVAIEIVQGGNPQILNNVIGIHTDVAGGAVTLGAAVTRALVDGNSACQGNAAPAGNNPYVDGAAANINHWGLNYDNGVYTLPA